MTDTTGGLTRRFHLQRDTDISGVSGTGRVADGILWTDGTASIRWLGDRPSIVFWDGGIADAEAIHGHGGATRIVWDDEHPGDPRTEVDPVYDPRAWETYSRDAGCGCTAPAPVDCKVSHGTGAWLCVCHRLSGPRWTANDPRGSWLTPDEEAIRKHFQQPNRCVSTQSLFRCSRPTDHPGDHRTGRTFWSRATETTTEKP
ncbi:hypothetical protein ACFVFJ_44565 [Streptomyces sp. NPDC057717]|uniref:hypothetical protein n=1 Tax=Streptomyces sp. NPDC057717 TaxID=3346224 RepID=UPI003687A0FF